MSTVVESVDVAVPVRTAYHQWTQFEEFPKFMEGVTEVRQLDHNHLHWVVDMAGEHHEFDAKITAQHPDERVAWKAESEPGHSGVVTLHRLDAHHTRVTVQLEDGDRIDMLKGDLERFRDFVQRRRRAAAGQ